MLRFFPATALIFVAAGIATAQTPIQLKPGAKVTVQRQAPSGRDTLTFSASAGQTLFLQRPLDDSHNDKDTLVVLPPGVPRPPGLPSRLDYSPESLWLNVLPATGVYQIVVTLAAGRKYSLGITLLDVHDPGVDPGISPADVRIPEMAVLGDRPVSLLPWEPEVDGEPGTYWTAGIGWRSERSHLRIMVLDEARKRLESPGSMDKLMAALQDGAALPNPKALPLEALDDARIEYAGVIGRIQGKSWRGLRWVAQYGQDRGPLEKRFQYTFEGISNDKRYFIVYITHVGYPDIPAALLQGPKDPGMRPDGKFDEKLSDKAWREYGDKVDAFLKTVKPERFDPSLLKLDAALRAIELR